MTTDSKSLTFYLPIPDKVLSPNARCHWAVKSKAVKAARTAAKTEACRVLGDSGCPAPRWAKARYTARLYTLPASRVRDPDNFIASLKSYLDGIADAQIVANDRDLWPERPEFHRCTRMPRVEIIVTPEI